MSISQVDASGQISLSSIQNMDVETALMAVQSNRTNLLEAQLRDQIAGVQARNNKIAALNQLLGALNKTAAAFPSDAKTDALVVNVPNAPALCTEVRNATVAAGMNSLAAAGGDANGFGGGVSKGTLDGKIAELKSMIDSQSNTQQMDMLRLQSLTNKRNEAYDLMSTFMKKCSDGRASIMSNMR